MKLQELPKYTGNFFGRNCNSLEKNLRTENIQKSTSKGKKSKFDLHLMESVWNVLKRI